MKLKERIGALRVDTTPLKESRDFRLLFWAGTVFYLGGMVSYVALPYQIYQLTGSNFAVGALGIVELVPLVVFGLYGGALADHVDRRRMLVVTKRSRAGKRLDRLAPPARPASTHCMAGIGFPSLRISQQPPSRVSPSIIRSTLSQCGSMRSWSAFGCAARSSAH